MRNSIVFLVVLGIVLTITTNARADDDVADFDFENVDEVQDYAYVDGVVENHNQEAIAPDLDGGGEGESTVAAADRRTDSSLDDIEFVDGQENVAAADQKVDGFVAKEKRIRLALQKATKQGVYTKKFAQLLPIMRALNKQQRIVLASLITAQSSVSQGKGLNLQQV